MEKVGRPKQVVEIGAYLSQHLVCLPFVHDPQCRIQLIEPNPKCVRELNATFKTFANIEIYSFAIAPLAGRVNLMIPKAYGRHSAAEASAFLESLEGSPYTSREQAGFPEKLKRKAVEAVTMDRFDDGSIDGLVIDTEGSEWYALENLVSRPAVISVEMEGPSSYRNPHFDDIMNWMNSENYQLHQIESVNRPEGRVPTDYIFVRNDLDN